MDAIFDLRNFIINCVHDGVMELSDDPVEERAFHLELDISNA